MTTEAPRWDQGRKIPRTFRLPADLDRELADVSVDRGVDKTAVVVQALRVHLAAGEGPAAAAVTASPSHAGKEQVPPEPLTGLVDLAKWLSGRTGLPHALCVQYVKRGRVTVNGRKWTRPSVPKESLGDIALDGEPLGR